MSDVSFSFCFVLFIVNLVKKDILEDRCGQEKV